MQEISKQRLSPNIIAFYYILIKNNDVVDKLLISEVYMKKNHFIICASFFLTLGISLCACNEPTSESKSENVAVSIVKPAFTVDIALNEVEEEFDPYTEKQSRYLSDTYDNISKYGSGSSENSKPNKLSLTWSVENPEVELTNLRLNLLEKDSTGAFTLGASYLLEKDTTSFEVTNLKVGQDYEWSITAISGDKEVESIHSSFKTKEGTVKYKGIEQYGKEGTANVRFIDIDGLSNVRDCGGWTGLDGKRIKQGLLYRGEEFNKQNNGRSGSGSTGVYDPSKVDPNDPYGQKISETGINTVVNELKIKTEVDIRGYETFDWESRVNYAPTECGGLSGALPDGSTDEEKGVVGIIDEVNYVICPVHTNRDKIYYDSYGRTACKNFFSMLADKETRLPLYFHCAQGKDRTGFLAYLFQAFLGCNEEDMMRDYLLSNMGKTGSVSVSKLVGSSANYNYVDYFNGKAVTNDGKSDQAEGDTIAERAYNYLLSCGLTSEQLDTIRDIFLED